MLMGECMSNSCPIYHHHCIVAMANMPLLIEEDSFQLTHTFPRVGLKFTIIFSLTFLILWLCLLKKWYMNRHNKQITAVFAIKKDFSPGHH